MSESALVGRSEVSRQSSKNLGGTHTSNMSGNAGGNQESIPVDNSINHYELPNLTQLLYDFTNKE